MYPELYNAGHSDFTVAGIPLTDAYNVMIRQQINTAAGMSFQMPRDSVRWKYVKKEAIVKVEGQPYIVKIINDGSDNGKPFGKVEATHIWWEICEKKHIPHAFFIGYSAPDILSSVFSGISYMGNPVRLLSSSEISALGLTPVTAATDIDMDKTNPLAVLSKVIDNMGGELYVDNFNFALVRQLGREAGLRFSLGRNLKGIERTEETTKLVTRLYPYGKEGLEITSVNGGKSYIDSPYINDYPYIHEGFIDFRDMETPAAILRRAQWEFSPDNYNRIDKPKLTYKCTAVDLWKLAEYGDSERLNLGDYATIHDSSLDMDSKVRAVEIDCYPYEPQNSVITLGDPPKTIGDILAELSGLQEYYYNAEPEVPDVVVETVIQSNEFVSTITNVAKQEVVAADVIHATNAFIEDAFVERLITNLTNFKCVPNLVLKEDESCEWAAGERTYSCSAPSEYGDIRPYIEMDAIFLRFIEAHLIPAANPSQLTLSQVEPLIIRGRQMYYTSILGGEAPYEWLTFTPPGVKYPEITAENAEMFKVYIRKAEVEYVKAAFDFNIQEIDGVKTFEPEIILGVGDENGNGKAYLRKSTEGMEMLYSSRFTGELLGVKTTDDGSFYKDKNSGEWVPIGTGGGNITLLDHQPTQAEIDEIADDTVVHIYDADNPFVPEG